MIMILKSESNQTKHINEITENDLKSNNWFWVNHQKILFMIGSDVFANGTSSICILRRLNFIGDDPTRVYQDGDTFNILYQKLKFKQAIRKFKELKYKKFDMYV